MRGGDVPSVDGPLRRWRALLCAVVLFGALALVDARLKAGEGPGYCPEHTTWIVAAEDLPAFWRGCLESDAVQNLTDEVPNWLGPFELATRRLTGIRPTPTRWSVWMGKAFLAAGSDESVGMCVRPGLLLRAAHVCRRVFRDARAEDGTYAFGPFYYAWRDGFLVLSARREYVTASLAAAGPRIEQSCAPDELRIHSHAGWEAFVRLYGRDGLPVEGWLDVDVSHRSTPLTLPNAWPESPMLSVTGTKFRDIRALLAWAMRAAEAVPFRKEAQVLADFFTKQWDLDSLPADWERTVNECSLALMSLDTSSGLPIPEVALIMRLANNAEALHPLRALASDVSAQPDEPPYDIAVPYEWAGNEGWIIPWMGEELALCLGSCQPDWFVTTQEPLMSRLAGGLGEGEAVDADAVVRVDWKKLGDCAQALARRAAELELIPRMDVRDVERKVLPVFRAIGRNGDLLIQVERQGKRAAFHGCLAAKREGQGPLS